MDFEITEKMRHERREKLAAIERKKEAEKEIESAEAEIKRLAREKNRAKRAKSIQRILGQKPEY